MAMATTEAASAAKMAIGKPTLERRLVRPSGPNSSGAQQRCALQREIQSGRQQTSSPSATRSVGAMTMASDQPYSRATCSSWASCGSSCASESERRAPSVCSRVPSAEVASEPKRS
eukprot:scaffold222107_cov27-Tisochrysis_lutea.AAC.5